MVLLLAIWPKKWTAVVIGADEQVEICMAFSSCCQCRPSDRASLTNLWRLQGVVGNDILKGSMGNDLGPDGGNKGSEIVEELTAEVVAV